MRVAEEDIYYELESLCKGSGKIWICLKRGLVATGLVGDSFFELSLQLGIECAFSITDVQEEAPTIQNFWRVAAD